MPPPKGDHGGIEIALAEAIGRYLYDRAIALGWDESAGRRARGRLVGYLAGGEAGIRFTLADDPDQVRGVDLLYLTPEQFAQAEATIQDEYIPLVPALAVEVISPSEGAVDVEEKVADYLAGGARLVWLLYPKTRTVVIYTPDNRGYTVPADGILDGGEVLPGFSAPLITLFL